MEIGNPPLPHFLNSQNSHFFFGMNKIKSGLKEQWQDLSVASPDKLQRGRTQLSGNCSDQAALSLLLSVQMVGWWMISAKKDKRRWTVLPGTK